MGVWGAELYANDVTCDVRDDYIDKLRQGLTNEDATKELIKSNQELIDDNEDVAAHNSCQKWRTTHVKAYLCI